MFAVPTTKTMKISVPLALIHLSVAVILFMLAVSFLLSIRKPKGNVSWLYFRTGFLRYVQIALVFSLILLLIFNLLVSFGLSTFPTFHWSLSILMRLIEVITIFYWLDSKWIFKNMFLYVEK